MPTGAEWLSVKSPAALREFVSARRAYLVGIPVEAFPKLFDLVATECDLPTEQIAQVDKDLAMLRGRD